MISWCSTAITKRKKPKNAVASATIGKDSFVAWRERKTEEITSKTRRTLSHATRCEVDVLLFLLEDIVF
jgi:hypothetical protein